MCWRRVYFRTWVGGVPSYRIFSRFSFVTDRTAKLSCAVPVYLLPLCRRFFVLFIFRRADPPFSARSFIRLSFFVVQLDPRSRHPARRWTPLSPPVNYFSKPRLNPIPHSFRTMKPTCAFFIRPHISTKTTPYYVRFFCLRFHIFFPTRSLSFVLLLEACQERGCIPASPTFTWRVQHRQVSSIVCWGTCSTF